MNTIYESPARGIKLNGVDHQGKAPAGWVRQIPRRLTRAQAEKDIVLIAMGADLLIIALSYLAAFWLRFRSDWLFQSEPEASLFRYRNLIFMGVILSYGFWLSKSCYTIQELLTPSKALGRFAVITSLAMLAFIAFDLTLRTTPSISRMYVVYAWATQVVAFGCWRYWLARHLRQPQLATHYKARVVMIGVNSQSKALQDNLNDHPLYEFAGWVEASQPDTEKIFASCRLGELAELGRILRENDVDAAVLLESDKLPAETVIQIQRVCQREHTQFKITPHFFEVMISGLHASFIGAIPVLGVENLPLDSYQNRLLKRIVDIVGACVGLVISLPLIAVFGGIVFSQSPGPIIYRQCRTGKNGREFYLYKIRSMKLDAEPGGKPQWTVADDPRRLAIGAFMRKWNIDEVPQFWNVLKGDMSLVGPRPERPELIEEFKFTVPNYQSRHSCRPGMTGWAQVNGLRGNTSLVDRIRYDIWYVENWSLLTDFRIIFLTFFKQDNAY